MLREACKLMADYYAALTGTVSVWFRADARRRLAAATAVIALLLMGVAWFDSDGRVPDSRFESTALDGWRRGPRGVVPRGDDDPTTGAMTWNETGSDRRDPRGEALPRDGAVRWEPSTADDDTPPPGGHDQVATSLGTTPATTSAPTHASDAVSGAASDGDNGSTPSTQPAAATQAEPPTTQPPPATTPSTTTPSPTGTAAESQCNPTGGLVGGLVGGLLCVADELL